MVSGGEDRARSDTTLGPNAELQRIAKHYVDLVLAVRLLTCGTVCCHLRQ